MPTDPAPPSSIDVSARPRGGPHLSIPPPTGIQHSQNKEGESESRVAEVVLFMRFEADLAVACHSTGRPYFLAPFLLSADASRGLAANPIVDKSLASTTSSLIMSPPLQDN